MAAALPKVPMHALNLGDRISPTRVARGRATGYRYAHSSSDMAPPVRFGEMVQPGRFSAQSKHSQAFLFEVLCFEQKGDYLVSYLIITERAKELFNKKKTRIFRENIFYSNQ